MITNLVRRHHHHHHLLLLLLSCSIINVFVASAPPSPAPTSPVNPSLDSTPTSPPSSIPPPPVSLPSSSSPPPPVSSPSSSTSPPKAPTLIPPASSPAAAAAAPPPSRPPTPPPIASPSPAPASAADLLDLDPSQILALEALKVNFSKSHPCTATPADVLLCNTVVDDANETSAKTRHLIALTLLNCPNTASLTTKTLANLSTLQMLHIQNCPFLKPVTVPSSLVDSLTSFFCIASLGRTGANQKAAKLSGSWISKLSRLQTLHVSDVQLDLGDGLFTVTQNLGSITELTLARGSYAGVLPRNTWPNYIRYIDVSGNSIRGTIPSQMGSLSQLEYLDISGNQIKGALPNIFGSLPNLQHLDLHGNQLEGPLPVSLAELRNLSYLDLGNNRFNGSIFANLSRISTLRYLDLSQNQLTGPIPFNASFLAKLKRLNLENNPGLCYNHSSAALRAIKALADIQDCGLSEGEVVYAPAPAPSGGLRAGADRRGRRLSAAASVGIATAVVVVTAALIFVGFRWWRSRESSDRFMDLAASQHKL